MAFKSYVLTTAQFSAVLMSSNPAVFDHNTQQHGKV